MGKTDHLIDGSRLSDNTDFRKSVSGASDAKGAQVEQFENVQSPISRVRGRKRVRSHCARFWLWWLIGVAVFLAIFLPLL